MIIVRSLLFLILITDIVCYVACTPHPGVPPRRAMATPHLGRVAYLGAYFLGVARLPYAILPYSGKLVLCGLLRERFSLYWQCYPAQALRLVGDIVQLGVGYVWLDYFSFNFAPSIIMLLQLAWGAEAVRLLTEKGGSVVSAVWQGIPHRTIARWLEGKLRTRRHSLGRSIRCYVAYYRRSDPGRLHYLRRCLKQYAIVDPTLAVPLAYFNGFQIVPDHHGLRGGNVRDVAQGLIFVHRRWSNDPWLLIGLVLRRSPWIFDPRYLSRPFSYRSQANRLMTLMVLQHAFLSPPFAWYQWGHQIKAARFELFYGVGAKLNLWREPPLFADGGAPYDPLMAWLYSWGKNNPPCQRQWSDEEVLFDVIVQSRRFLSDMEIAKRYGYPLLYVHDVLGPLIRRTNSTLPGSPLHLEPVASSPGDTAQAMNTSTRRRSGEVTTVR